MNTEVMFSSETDLWATPQDFFDKLDKEFGFDLDVCATDENAKCDIYYTVDDDCLKQDWHKTLCGRPVTCWMNPKYGDPEFPCKPRCKKKRCKKRGHCIDKYDPGIVDFMRKAHNEALKGCTVVCLVPSRTDTGWWHEFVLCDDAGEPHPQVDIRYLKGRLKFGNAKNSAPFPSAVVIYRPPTLD